MPVDPIATILGIQFYVDAELRGDEIRLWSNGSYSSFVLHEQLSLDRLREVRSDFVRLHGRDADTATIHPNNADEVLELAMPVEAGRPSILDYATTQNTRIRTFVAEPAEEQNPFNVPRTITIDGDLVLRASNQRIRLTKHIQSSPISGEPRFSMSLELPTISVFFDGRNDLHNQTPGEISALAKRARVQAFKQVSRWLKSEFERIKEEDPTAINGLAGFDNPPF